MTKSSNPLNMHKIGPGGIVLEINVNDADTPALVWDSLKKRNSATYDCACGTGGIDDAALDFTPQQQAWLDQYADRVAAAYDFARKDDPRYR